MGQLVQADMTIVGHVVCDEQLFTMHNVQHYGSYERCVDDPGVKGAQSPSRRNGEGDGAGRTSSL